MARPLIPAAYAPPIVAPTDLPATAAGGIHPHFIQRLQSQDAQFHVRGRLKALQLP